MTKITEKIYFHLTFIIFSIAENWNESLGGVYVHRSTEQLNRDGIWLLYAQQLQRSLRLPWPKIPAQESL